MSVLDERQKIITVRSTVTRALLKENQSWCWVWNGCGKHIVEQRCNVFGWMEWLVRGGKGMTDAKVVKLIFNGKEMVEKDNCAIDLSEYRRTEMRYRVVAEVKVIE